MQKLQYRTLILILLADVDCNRRAPPGEEFPLSGILELLLTNEPEKEITVDTNCADLIIDRNRPARYQSGFSG
jgi:hypothetical protein